MTIYEMHTNLKLSLDKSDSLDSIYFEQEELDYWLNRSIRSLVKTKYKGSSSARGEAFEQNQKRIDDLRTLVQETSISTTASTNKPNSYQASLPSSYWFTISEEVLIAYQSSTTAASTLVENSVYVVSGGSIAVGADTYSDGEYFIAGETSVYSGDGSAYLCSTVRKGITEVTADTYRFHIDDPYSEHILVNNDAKPLRLFKENTVELITDGSYAVMYYYLRYLKEPDRINILEISSLAANTTISQGLTYLVSGGTVTYNDITYNIGDTFTGVSNVTTCTGSGTLTTVVVNCNLPEHIHDEIIVTAADMLIENIENPRVQSHMREILRSE